MTDKLIFETESIGGRTIRILRNQDDGDVTVEIVDDPPILNQRGEPINFDVVLTGDDATAMARALLAGSGFSVVPTEATRSLASAVRHHTVPGPYNKTGVRYYGDPGAPDCLRCVVEAALNGDQNHGA